MSHRSYSRERKARQQRQRQQWQAGKVFALWRFTVLGDCRLPDLHAVAVACSEAEWLAGDVPAGHLQPAPLEGWEIVPDTLAVQHRMVCGCTLVAGPAS